MKITEQEVIQNGEKELIDAITGDLDWTAIEEVFQNKYNLGLQEDVEYKQGDIVVHNNNIAYRLDFDVKVTLSVFFDRKGEYLEVKALGEKDEEDEEIVEQLLPEPDTENLVDQGSADNESQIHPESEIDSSNNSDNEINENVTQMATQIADMISEINQD